MTEWVPICESLGAQPVEIETEDDLTLSLASVQAHFPGTTTLKYRAPGGTTYRGVKLTDTTLYPPSEGWATAKLYVCVNPTAESNKRKEQEDRGSQEYQPQPKKPWTENTNSYDDDSQVRDMILLGMKPSTTEATIRKYFEDKANVLLCQVKRSKDNQTGYAFIKFDDKETERQLRRQKHHIDGRECTLKIPDSRASQGDRGERKVYVSYHDETLTMEEIREHFEQFGDVEDVFVPTPWRHFAFVTFSSASVAQSLIGKEHNVRGVSLLMKKGQAPKGKGGEPVNNDNGADDGSGDWGGWARGLGPPLPGMGGPPGPGLDHWQMYAKMMQEMYHRGPPGGAGSGGPGACPPLPQGPSPNRGGRDSRGGPPGPGGPGYSWPGQSEYGYGGDRIGAAGFGGPSGVNKY